MSWFHWRDRPTPARTNPEAMRAVERAHAANTEALAAQEEMHEITGRIREQRDWNHFAPLIYDAMRKKRS